MSVFSQSGTDPRDGASLEAEPGAGLPSVPDEFVSQLIATPRGSVVPRIEITVIGARHMNLMEAWIEDQPVSFA